MKASLRNPVLWAIIAILLLLTLFILMQQPRPNAPDIPFSRFLGEVEQGRVREVLILGPEIYGTDADGRSFQSYAPSDSSWIQRLYGKGVSITVRPQQSDVPWYISLLVSWLPFLAFIAVWVSLSRQQMRSWSEIAKRPHDQIDGLERKVDDLQKRLGQLSEKDKA
jgi:cell division protease FtsH